MVEGVAVGLSCSQDGERQHLFDGDQKDMENEVNTMTGYVEEEARKMLEDGRRALAALEMGAIFVRS